MKIWKNILLVLGIMMLFASFAAAQQTGGVTDIGPSESGTDSVSGQATLEGGNVTEVNVSGTLITTKWGGFYGFISGGIELNDASSNHFYVWTITNFTGGVVYATNDTISSWTLEPISHLTAPVGVTTAASDDFNHTFSSLGTFDSPSMAPINNVPYVNTYQDGSAGTLPTYGLVVTGSPTINLWAGMIETNATSFKSGELVDYQILAPAKSTGTVYNFYLEMP